jgi:hypothetical protein
MTMALIKVNGAYAFGPLPSATTGAQLVPDAPARSKEASLPNVGGTSVPDRSSSLGTARTGSVFSRRPFSPLIKDQ